MKGNKYPRVCHITTVHPPYDVRIFHKECASLRNAGFELYLVATYDKDEEIKGIRIKALPKCKNKFERILKNSIIVLKRPLEIKAEVYHFHNSKFIFVGLILKFFGKKIIYDVHENPPKDILTKEWIRKAISITFDRIERLVGKFFDMIIVLSPEIVERFPREKTILVHNLPDLSLVKKSQPVIIKKMKSIIICAGGLNKFRGIKELINAIHLLKGKAKLWLLGDWQEAES